MTIRLTRTLNKCSHTARVSTVNMSSPVKVVFGAASFKNPDPEHKKGFTTTDQVKSALSLLKQYSISDLDVARIYGTGRAEELLGEVGSTGFTVSTKAAPAVTKFTKGGVQEQLRTSLDALKLPEGQKLDIYYLHWADRETDFIETAEAIQEGYKAGKFERFGISNFTAKETQQMYDICSSRGYVLPTVYQGNYNPITRKNETELFPTLRKLGINFYGYSPLAGGILATGKSFDGIRTEKGGRFSMAMYADAYLKEPILKSIENFQEVCASAGTTTGKATYGWLRHHSALKSGDAFIIGASGLSQLEQNLEESKDIGRLSNGVLDSIEQLWQAVEEHAPKYHF